MYTSVDREELLKDLTERGKDHGFLIEQSETFDLAWCLRRKEPVISFLVGANESNHVFNKTINMYWSSADYALKPWSHYCIILNSLAAEHEALLLNLANQYKIKIFEGVTGLRENIENDVNYLLSKFNTLGVSDIEDLRKKVSQWSTQKTKISKKLIKSAEPDDIKIIQSYVEKLNSRETLPVILEIGSAKQEGILLRAFINENGFALKTEHRNLPLILEIDLSQNLELNLGFEYDKSNIHQAIIFQELLVGWDQKEEIKLVESNSGEKILSLKNE